MDDASGEKESAQRDSAALLGAALARKFHEHNYTSQYLARRCRTEAEVVESWRAGAVVPNFRDWWHLLRVHRSFDALTALWKMAAADAGVSVEDPSFVGDRRQRETPFRKPTDPAQPESPVERITQVTRVIEVRAPEDVDIPGLPPRDPVGRDAPSPHPHPPSTAAAPSSPSAGLDDESAIRVPAGFVVYRCRISRGRILEIPLPLDLSRSDVERLGAFLYTAIDEEGESRR